MVCSLQAWGYKGTLHAGNVNVPGFCEARDLGRDDHGRLVVMGHVEHDDARIQ